MVNPFGSSKKDDFETHSNKFLFGWISASRKFTFTVKVAYLGPFLCTTLSTLNENIAEATDDKKCFLAPLSST